jgi:hypothetical protein
MHKPEIINILCQELKENQEILLNKLPDHIIYEVSKGILLFSRAGDFRIDFLNYSWKKYFDIARM